MLDRLRTPLWSSLEPFSGALPSVKYRPHTVDQFESIARATPASMAGHALNTLIAMVALKGHAHPLEIAAWALCSLGLCVYVFMRRKRTTWRRPHTAPVDCRRRERRARIVAALLALPWAYLIVRFLGSPNEASETILISLGVGMAASGAVLLAPVERAAIVYTSVILGPTAIKCALLAGTAQYALLGMLTISYFLFLMALIATTNQLFKHKALAVERLEASLAETSAARVRIEHIAMHDALTELFNRRAFLHRLNRRIAATRKTGMPNWAVLFLDLDRFKTVNDTLGHRFGDELLKLAAARLSRSMRPHDVVARMGGDEFSILAEGVDDERQARAIAMRLQRELAKPFNIQGHNVTIGVSIGIAMPQASVMDAEQLMKCADLAMYEVKSNGRNGHKVFEAQMAERMEHRRSIEMGLQQALAEQEFELYFQPIYDLETLKVARFEALIRWQHPTRGLLQPAEFLPVAEEMGLITEIGTWVLQEGCRHAADWPDDVILAVNLSPIQVNQPDLLAVVRSALVRSGLRPQRLEIEITETALLFETHQIRDSLEQLKGLGVSLSIDDFGTGYSSLSYLASFPLDGMKIDKGFIGRYGARRENAEVMRAMVGLAKALNRTSTVEGIETEEHLAVTRSLGATYGQGYYFSRPKSADRVSEMLADGTEIALAEVRRVAQRLSVDRRRSRKAE